jgi:hypothetical protein
MENRATKTRKNKKGLLEEDEEEIADRKVIEQMLKDVSHT